MKNPTITVGTPMIAGNRQDLRLQITMDCNVRIAVPLGDTCTDLMTKDQFKNKETQISLRPLSEPDSKGEMVEVVSRPDGLEEPVVDRDAGHIDLSITKVKIFVFNIWISNFIVQKDKGLVAIELRAEPEELSNPWPVLDTKTAEKEVLEPRITSFLADRYNVGNGGPVKLEWTIDPPGNFELRAGEAVLEKGEQRGGGQWNDNVSERGPQDLILEAWAGQKPARPDTRRLHIDITSKTWKPRFEFSPPKWTGSPGVLGLYAHPGRGRLYALLRFPNSPSYASLWYTEHGFDPSPWKEATRTGAWREATRKGDGKKPLIPVKAARRPGAIFNDKLFLIGGDCCSPNSAGSGVGFCELNEHTGLDWQEVRENHPWGWPKTMNERMGHAVVVLPEKKGLWVMGGWRQDGGICDDVWQFSGTAEFCLEPSGRIEDSALPVRRYRNA